MTMNSQSHRGDGPVSRSAAKAPKRVLVGPFAAILIAALFLIALQWYRNGPSSVGSSSVVPAVFTNQPLTVAAGLAQADAERKTLIAFATASWCGPCQSFKRGTLADHRVASAMRAAGVPAYIDVDKDNDGAAQLKVFSIPALVALRGGKEVGRMEGNRSVPEVLEWLNSLPTEGTR